MIAELYALLCFWHIENSYSMPIGRSQMHDAHYIAKRNVFDPIYPPFPTQGVLPFVQPLPYPIQQATPSPYEKFLPQPPSEGHVNPFMKQIHQPYDPNFGFGLAQMRPISIGGQFQWPTYDIAQDTDSVSGTFGAANPYNLRYGMQGGPFYPWMNDKYVNSVQQISKTDDLRSALLSP